MGRRNSAAERGQGGGCVFEREKKAERERGREREGESNLIRRQDCGNLLILPFLRLSNLFPSFYPLFSFFYLSWWIEIKFFVKFEPIFRRYYFILYSLYSFLINSYRVRTIGEKIYRGRRAFSSMFSTFSIGLHRSLFFFSRCSSLSLVFHRSTSLFSITLNSLSLVPLFHCLVSFQGSPPLSFSFARAHF